MDFRDKTARLRRTFRYAADHDSDSDSQPEAMDEQEQEDLINRLVAENTSGNATFARFLLALPIAATLPYVLALARPATRLLALLSITSLLSTAFLLHRLPHTETGIEPLDSLRGGSRKQKLVLDVGGVSPLEKYLPYLNLALVVLLVLMGMVTKSDSARFGWIGMGNLPALVYGTVLASKTIMASVDPASELSKLRYEYKGA
ncbi:hypothetical protein ACRE_045430 [Hapsidospora chrysogenum ATCC 11550]|uniref:Uncharacterized protein n=1 Tax=Hapsidospora chrysogenum (strain ATCC 11550 / CBS 779.69 / DSM 880 / IAM 14645 / JCM 23072 / IMI 49137) TaxID=857340 RepID=A0A086T5N4_HAPC1|nr:hypothetical protein ACRE_045430 [Hapsidospora chrysogenum ATCC 11550]